MPKIEVTRTELVWQGKYDEEGNRREVPRVSLPFQVIETINESRATREAAKTPKNLSLFDVWEGTEGDTFDDGWRNKLIWGDNLLVMGSLLEKFAGKIDLVYIDPPFATGADFSFKTDVGEGGPTVTKEQSIIEEKAYRDTWGQGTDSFLAMIASRLHLIRDLLSEKGSLYLHIDWRMSSHLRLLLDEVFGPDQFRAEIIWKRTSAHSDSSTFGQVHDTILYYTKSKSFIWNEPKTDYEEWYVERYYRYKDKRTGKRFMSGDLSASGLSGGGYEYTWKGRKGIWRCPESTMAKLDAEDRIFYTENGVPRFKRFLDEMEGRPVQSLWDDLQGVVSWSDQQTGYATQKPEALVNRIIAASSHEGSLVADFFCGSGTTLAAAEKLKRRWVGCDLGRFAVHTTRKRLLEIEGSKPFEVLNLGKYERQYWQGVTFGDKGKSVTEKALYEYLAFILKLYGAQPVSGLAHLHGKYGKAMVHIGAVDAPVTIDEINAAIAECRQVKQNELHVLGWEWEMGLYDLMVTEAKKKDIKLLLLQIPREVMEQQAVDKGDIAFFELAYLEVETGKPKKLTAQVTLKNFVIPNTELIPEDVRQKVKKWSDYIDYWAVDWDFRDDTFMQGWVTYRTRKNRTLPLTSDPHAYEKAGRYRVLVKVVDIFGNDTSQAFDVEVK